LENKEQALNINEESISPIKDFFILFLTKVITILTETLPRKNLRDDPFQANVRVMVLFAITFSRFFAHAKGKMKHLKMNRLLLLALLGRNW